MFKQQTRLFGLLLFLVALLLFIYRSSAQTDSPFTLAGTDAVISNSDSVADWDGIYTDPGAVLYHDGRFHMFRNGFNGWPASVQIGYLTSEDGVNWTEATEDPVLKTEAVPYAGVAALASSALVEDDGTWVLYFYTWEKGSPVNSPGAIGRATADSPLGPWTPDAEPLLKPGSEGAWDSLMVNAPSVLKTEDGYVMYYAGFDKRGLPSGKIGMAASDDGIHWTKYDNPKTSDAEFAESDPVFWVEGDLMAHQPNVIYTPEEGWGMMYRQVKPGAGNMTLQLARSDDGITWETLTTDPIWTLTSIPGARGFWWTRLLRQEDTYYLYIEAGVGRNTRIFAATHEGSLFE
jgi:predicted GH43/DUF377 family glycosyl hydrolase